MHFCDLCRNRGISRNPTKTPTSHGVRLRKAVAHDNAVVQFAIATRKAKMHAFVAFVHAFVNETRVHIVADDKYVMSFCEFRNRIQGTRIEHATRGIVRGREHDCLRAIGCRHLKLSQRELEFGWTRVDGNERRAVHRDNRFIQTKRRRGYEHFIARIKNARKRREQCLGRTASHDDFVFTIGKVALFHVSRNRTTQFHRAVIGRIVRFVCSKRFCNFLLHDIGGIAVWFAERKQNAPRRLLRESRNATNPRRLQLRERGIGGQGHKIPSVRTSSSIVRALFADTTKP